MDIVENTKNKINKKMHNVKKPKLSEEGTARLPANEQGEFAPEKPININTNNIMLWSVDPCFYKKFFYNTVYIDVYIDKPEGKDYYLLFQIKNNPYYIKSAMLDKIDNVENLKKNGSR